MSGMVLVGIVVVAVIILLIFYQQNLMICQPSEVLIFSGSKQTMKNGREVGYRIIKGGSAFRIPLFEEAHRLDLSNMVIELSVRGAYSKGGIPLNVQGVANVKIAGDEPFIVNAIERFLGLHKQEILKIIKETLEGNLRGVLATLTPEQVNEDKEKFAESLLHEAEHDLSRLGIVLDNLKIQNVTDDAGYLSSIGRKKSAQLQKESLVAEARSKADTAVRTAKNEEDKALKAIENDMKVTLAEAQRKIGDAQTRKDAVVAEEKGTVVKLMAKAKAELEVQTARVEQVRRKLAAEVLEPAKAECAAAEARAKGDAAKIIEDGRASAEAFRQLVTMWKAAGPNAKDILLLQKLDVLVKASLMTVDKLKINRITVVKPAENGSSSLAGTALALNEELRSSTGVDVAAALRKLSDKKA